MILEVNCGSINKKTRQKGIKENAEHLSRTHKQHYRIYHTDGIHPTITASEQVGRYWIMQSNHSVRKLTPRECARLQGFPDSFIILVSDNQAYKQFGNAVSVPVVKAVAKGLLQSTKKPLQ